MVLPLTRSIFAMEHFIMLLWKVATTQSVKIYGLDTHVRFPADTEDVFLFILRLDWFQVPPSQLSSELKGNFLRG
jgi:hypothetical protein